MSEVVVLHEDAHLVAVDKPAGRIVVPGRAAGERSLREELEVAHGRLWVVHRLDRGTTGVLVLARSAEAHRTLNLAFDRGEPRKTYLALVRGIPAERSFRVEVSIAAGRKGRMRPGRPGEPGVKPASTEFRVQEAFPAGRGLPDLALLEARPETGRTHQIRVHLAAAGHPLAVDPVYGEDAPLAGEGGVLLARTPLHAARLEIAHPVSGTPLAIDAPLPEDLAGILRVLRGVHVRS